MRSFVLLSLLFFFCGAESTPATRQYFIAAVEIGWDYLHLDAVDKTSDERRRSKDAPQKYIKAVYREYTDATYSMPKFRPAWAGIQGPVIQAQAGDRVVIHFKNLASQPYSISPVGVTYWKQSEGAGYDDATAGQEKEDDAVPTGGYYQYVWDVHPRDGPTSSDPECLTYSYSSQVDTVRDFNSGLIGALLICKSSAFNEGGDRRSREFVLIFAVFDETKSWYGEVGQRRLREKYKKTSGRKQYHTINGYINSTLPGLTMCQSRDYISWHLIGMGTAPEIHSIQFQEHALQVMVHRKVTLEMNPMTFTTAEMKPSTVGRFLISCQIHDHRHEGMSALFTVEDCPEPVTVRPPDLWQVNHDEDYDEDYNFEEEYGNGEELFSSVVMKPGKVRAEGRSSKGSRSKTWVHYIAAEELNWDYAPHLHPGDRWLSSEFFPTRPQSQGYQYKKVAFVEYTDRSFTKKKTSKKLIGPLLKGEINDQFQIIFKNLARWPFNMYPVGLTKVYPLIKTNNEAERDLRAMAVPPNGTFGYLWKLTSEDGPLDGDHQCLTRLYQSTVDPERDLASGLVGPLLICKHKAIDQKGKLVGPDRDESLMFTVFDENRSWYFSENIQKYSPDPSTINPSDPDFYNANVIYSINGIMFNGRQFLMCKSDVTFWHVANVGTQSRFLSVYFTGNPFQRDQVYESVLTLFPMSGETVPVESELNGEWEISAFDGSLKGRGMTIRYTVRSCDRDLPLAEDEESVYDDDFSDYLDTILPRGQRSRPVNLTKAVRVCKKPASTHNSTSPSTGNVTSDAANDVTIEIGDEGLECELRYVEMPASNEEEANQIPPEVLAELERDKKTIAVAPQGGGLGVGQPRRRQRRQAGEVEGKGGTVGVELEVQQREEVGDYEAEAGGWTVGEGNETMGDEEGNFGNETEVVDRRLIRQANRAEAEETNDILEDCYSSEVTEMDPLEQLKEGQNSKDLDQNLETQNHIQIKSEPLPLDLLDLDHANVPADVSANDTANDTTNVSANDTTNVSTSDTANVSANVSDNDTANVSANVSANDTTSVSANDTTNVSANDKANVSANDTTNVSANVLANDTANVSANDTTNVSANVSANDTTNVSANDKANVSANDITNVSANVSANDTTNVSTNVSANVSANDTTNVSANVSANYTTNVSANDTTNVSGNVSANDTTNVSANDTTNVSANDTTNVSANVSANDTTNVSANVSANDTTNVSANDTTNVSANVLANDPASVSVNDTTNVSASDRASLGLELSQEYDDYNTEENAMSDVFHLGRPDPRSSGGRYPSYYIAAQEINWDYGIRKPPQLITPEEIRRGMRKFLPEYKKVVFRSYRDKDFQNQVTRGELQEHLGIMGPLIRAEVNDLLTVTFKNMASRPYSLHLHGVYDRSQEGSLAGEPVPPGEVRVYTWRVSRTQGPTNPEFDCKAGAYYSTLNKEKDLHSGLIGPLVICKQGTLDTDVNLQPDVQEYSLLFHTFDETKSWYQEENLQQHCTPPCQARPEDPSYQSSNRFAAINGYVAETIPGLLVAQHQRVRWHLLNVGGDGEYHAVQFHGLPFSVQRKKEHRMGIYNLYPGVFGTVEMRPSTVGTWLVECTVGEHQLAGMRAKLLVYNPGCVQPFGMRSGRIEDSQITASDYIDNWEPKLARLELSGRVNAWMGGNKRSWLQVDLQRPSLVHGLQTQGAKSSLGLKDFFIMHFTISYSLDLETWTTYRGNSTKPKYIFNGNIDGSKVKENRLDPPILGRYIRIQPITILRNPALRLELLGCDLNSCSFPLGLEKRLVPDSSFSSSSSLHTWRHSWSPALARLHQEGSANAWRPKSNNPHEWLQVDFLTARRITGVVTQGARSLLTQMMVTEFTVTVSDNSHTWSSVLEDNSQREKVFSGNSEPDEEALSIFDPPLFGRYIRIHPRGWVNHIALRLEFLGCDTQQHI